MRFHCAARARLFWALLQFVLPILSSTACNIADANAPGASDGLPDVITPTESPQWTIVDDGAFVTAENDILRLKFAYNAAASAEWFKGGGGLDGGVVELYYKPTSASRNLVFRSGAWGSKKDNMDHFEAEGAAEDGLDHNTPDFSSGTDAELVTYSVHENAGRLLAEFTFQFQAWLLTRTYTVYPWGDITVHVSLSITESSRWNYLGHRFAFAASRYGFTTDSGAYDWGGNYQDDGEFFYAWTDGYTDAGRGPQFRYAEQIRQRADTNTAAQLFGRDDAYVGFMLDDENGNDPDIVVLNGDSAARYSAFGKVAASVGGTSYVESGIYSAVYAPDSATYAGITWFYGTIPCCPPQYGNPMEWPTSLGTWEESFHVMLRRDLTKEAFLPLWRARTRDFGQLAPVAPTNAAVVFRPRTRLYHLIADASATEVAFSVPAPPEDVGAIYRTVVVVENLQGVDQLRLENGNGRIAEAYHDADTGTTVIVLTDLEGFPPPRVVITQASQ